MNADSIANGLSPFNPESVALESGRIMLQRIHQLMDEKADFAFETTLATRSYASLTKRAKTVGYEISLLFFWLSSPEFAKRRVAKRVSKGGHNIPADIVERRYYRGINNLVNSYIPIVDNWMVIDNMGVVPAIIAKGSKTDETVVSNSEYWSTIINQSKSNGK